MASLLLVVLSAGFDTNILANKGGVLIKLREHDLVTKSVKILSLHFLTTYISSGPTYATNILGHLLNYHLEGHRELVEFDIHMGHQFCLRCNPYLHSLHLSY